MCVCVCVCNTVVLQFDDYVQFRSFIEVQYYLIYKIQKIKPTNDILRKYFTSSNGGL